VRANSEGNADQRAFAAIAATDPHLHALLLHARRLQLLQHKLQELLPAELVGHLSVANVQQQTLVLNAESAVWATRARFQLDLLRDRIQLIDIFKEIKDIRLRISPVGEAAPVAAPAGPVHSGPGAEALRRGAELAEGGALGQALARLASHVDAEKGRTGGQGTSDLPA
jgi:hypothetical protein